MVRAHVRHHVPLMPATPGVGSPKIKPQERNSDAYFPTPPPYNANHSPQQPQLLQLRLAKLILDLSHGLQTRDISFHSVSALFGAVERARELGSWGKRAQGKRTNKIFIVPTENIQQHATSNESSLKAQSSLSLVYVISSSQAEKGDTHTTRAARNLTPQGPHPEPLQKYQIFFVRQIAGLFYPNFRCQLRALKIYIYYGF